MRKSEDTLPSSDKKTTLALSIWETEGKPQVIVQLTHGMAESIERYEEFAAHLCDEGFSVVGYDLLSHGASVREQSQWGDYEVGKGADQLIADTDAVRKYAQRRFGTDIPYFLLGHSMGSFITRAYIGRFGAGLSGAIICGTGEMAHAKSALGHAVARTIGVFRGSHYRSSFVDSMGVGAYNKHFEPARTPLDWLSKNEKSVDAYISDPRDGFMFTVGGYAELTRLMMMAGSAQTYADTPSELPLLIISGADDSVGDFGKGPSKVYDSYISSGHDSVTLKLYEGDRHEILQELDRADVFADVSAWIKSCPEVFGEVK